MADLNTSLLWELFRNGKTWLTNLQRAGRDRKLQSRKALREIIIASRETAVYMRQMKDTGKADHNKEARLSILWTNLGFSLEDLGIPKLAKRCSITGKIWADPSHYDEDFIDKADVSLESIERMAREILAQMGNENV